MAHVRTGLAFVLLLTLIPASIPTATASTGCWYTETTQQELLAVGSDVAYLELEQPVYSATCGTSDRIPAAVHCAGVGADGSLTTPPVTVFEVRVLGITVVEEGVLVPEQTVPAPTDPDLVLLNEPRCASERPVVRLVIETEREDTVIGSDGTVEVGQFSFLDEVLGLLPPGLLDDLLGEHVPTCDNIQTGWRMCRGGDGPLGFLVIRTPLGLLEL